MSRRTALKRFVANERGHILCENCTYPENVSGEYWDNAHIFFGQDNRKGKGFDRYVDVKYNVAKICKKCHAAKLVDNYDFRRVFMGIQISRYGYEAMDKWLSSFPAKKRWGTEWTRTYVLLNLKDFANDG